MVIWERTQHPKYTRHVPLKIVCEVDETADTTPVFGLVQLCLGVCGTRLPERPVPPAVADLSLFSQQPGTPEHPPT